MWLDAVALVLLGAFAGLGALRGGLAGALALASLLLGYALGAFAASHYAAPLAGLLGLPEWAGMAAAGTAAFAVVAVAFRLLARVLRRFSLLGSGREASTRDRFVGALFGGVRGALVVVLLGTLANWVDALRVAGVAPALPPAGASVTAIASSRALETGVEATLSGSPAQRVVARLVARPAASIAAFQKLVEHPRVDSLRDDAMFWTYVKRGAVDSAMNQASFAALAADEPLRGELAELGLVAPEEARDPAAFRAAMRRVLGDVGPRLQAIERDPEFQALLRDPEVLALVQQGDTLGLMANARFRSVVTRVASAPATGDQG